MRSRIAHLAARLMAEDGIDDFGLAKRKAARQAGAPDTRNLPDTAEVEQALRVYRQLYQAREQADRIHDLRGHAVATMRQFEAFDPHLIGSVRSGNAGRYADIELILFADSAKEVELFLINHRMQYRAREDRYWIGDDCRLVPGFDLETPSADVHMSVLDPRDRRLPLRTAAEGRPIDRARRAWVERELAATAAVAAGAIPPMTP